jgi:hypothetical protein
MSRNIVYRKTHRDKIHGNIVIMGTEPWMNTMANGMAISAHPMTDMVT